MHIISAQNTHQRPSLRSNFQNFLGGGPPNTPSGRGSPPPTPTPVSALRASKCPYRPLAPCPFQILAGALLNKLGRPHIPNATYQVPRSLALGFWRRRFLKGFYHIWAWRPSWSCDQEHLNKLLFPRPKESPYEI